MVFFSGGRGGGEQVDYGYKGKGVTSHLLVDLDGRPLAVTATSAKGDERDQVDPLLRKIKSLIQKVWKQGKVPVVEADKGYDAERVRKDVLKNKVFPLISRRKNSKAEMGICYLEKSRWKVERTISWLKTKYRRISTRWERKMKYWNGFLQFSLIGYWLKFLTQNIF
jgi:transposase